MQSNSSPTAGTGLNLADYYGWQPGLVAPPGTFDRSGFQPVFDGEARERIEVSI
jgi:hypothetical protein